jgi:hypothetical protein
MLAQISRNSEDSDYYRRWEFCQFLIIALLLVVHPVSDFLFEV